MVCVLPSPLFKISLFKTKQISSENIVIASVIVVLAEGIIDDTHVMLTFILIIRQGSMGNSHHALRPPDHLALQRNSLAWSVKRDRILSHPGFGQAVGFTGLDRCCCSDILFCGGGLWRTPSLCQLQQIWQQLLQVSCLFSSLENISPPGRVGGHYFLTWCLSVHPKN